MSKQKENGIGWCDFSWNPWIGCTKVSPACDNCYAEGMAKRFFKDAQWGNHPRKLTSDVNWKKPIAWNRKAKPVFTAWEMMKEEQGITDGQLIEAGFVKPVKPRVFCGSMCDVFDNQAPLYVFINLIMKIYDTPHLDWLLLTKRVGNAQQRIDDAMKFLGIDEALPNIWLGITVCNQEEADRDIPKLLATPAIKRFLSIEPMLERIDLSKWIDQIDWVIVGGETGHNARPMHPDWARSIRDQCQSEKAPFFFKQMTKKAEIPSDLMIREFPL